MVVERQTKRDEHSGRVTAQGGRRLRYELL